MDLRGRDGGQRNGRGGVNMRRMGGLYKAAALGVCLLACAGTATAAEPAKNDDGAKQAEAPQRDVRALRRQRLNNQPVDDLAGATYGAPSSIGLRDLPDRKWNWFTEAIESLAARPRGDELELTSDQIQVYSDAVDSVEARMRSWLHANADEVGELEVLMESNANAHDREQARLELRAIAQERPTIEFEIGSIWKALSPNQRVAVLWEMATNDAIEVPDAVRGDPNRNPRRVRIERYLDSALRLERPVDDHTLVSNPQPGSLTSQLLDVDEASRAFAVDIIVARYQFLLETLPFGRGRPTEVLEGAERGANLHEERERREQQRR